MSGSEELALGDVLDGKYIIEELIGRGGMGAVYRARHVELGSTRAIKIMRRELAQDAAFVRRFRNEPRLAEGVRHPNVVSVYDFSTLDDGTSYIVWEYVEGDNVAELLARGTVFTNSEVANVVEHVGDGLSAAHGKAILHRDVSPDNIMICTDARGGRNVKLLDFGVAKGGGIPGETPTDASMLFGKIGYASPEQMGLLKDDELLDARTDVFSLAAVAYTMLTGESPFRTTSLQAFVHDLIIAPEAEVRGRYLERLPEPWRAPLSRALARDREARPATANAFVAEVKKAAKAMGSEGSGIQKAEPVAPRWRSVLYASAVAGVMVAITVAVTTTTREAIRAPVTIGEPSAKGRQAFPDVTVGLAEPAIAEASKSGDAASELAEEPLPSAAAPRETESSQESEDAQTNGEQIAAPIEPERSSVEEARVDLTPRESPAAEPKHPNPIDDKTTDAQSGHPQPPAAAPPEPQPKTATPVIPPRLKFQKEPVYPPIAMSKGVEGDVILKVWITSQGDVTDVEVVRSIPLLDGAAIEAARQRKYEPALVDGVAVPFEMGLKIQFEIR